MVVLEAAAHSRSRPRPEAGAISRMSRASASRQGRGLGRRRSPVDTMLDMASHPQTYVYDLVATAARSHRRAARRDRDSIESNPAWWVVEKTPSTRASHPARSEATLRDRPTSRPHHDFLPPRSHQLRRRSKSQAGHAHRLEPFTMETGKPDQPRRLGECTVVPAYLWYVPPGRGTWARRRAISRQHEFQKLSARWLDAESPSR